MEKLALYGGTPVVSPERPLPEVMPRLVAPEAYALVTEVLDGGFATDMTQRFEEKFASLHNAKHAVAVSNCSAAIHVALAVLGVGAGDEVVVTPVSDYGSHLGILAQNALPVFADIDPDTGNCTAETIEKAISPYTKAIIVVHWHGLISDMDPIVELSGRTGIPVIEDCCQCPLGEYKGRKAGTFGAIGCFSTDAEKQLSTEHGGMLITQDKELAEKAYRYAIMRGAYVQPDYGRRYDMMGLNYRFGQMEAAVGLAQLDILPGQNSRRVELAERLQSKLAAIDGILPLRIPEGSMCLYWIFPVIFDLDKFTADTLMLGKAIAAEGVNGCSHMPYYLITDGHRCLQDRKGLYGDTACPFDCPYQRRRLEYGSLDLPGAELYVNRTIRWVWTDKYTDGDIDAIYQCIRKVCLYFHKERLHES